VEMTVTAEQAVEYAQKYLDTNDPGATAADDPISSMVTIRSISKRKEKLPEC